jgi:hypothetical protein
MQNINLLYVSDPQDETGSHCWWYGPYPLEQEELKTWAASLTMEQLRACPDRQPAPWDSHWDAWQAVQREHNRRLNAAQLHELESQPTQAPPKKRARKTLKPPLQ